jgi:hypothetical protein
MIIESYSESVQNPSPQEVALRVDEFLQSPPLVSLQPQREQIIEEILRRLTTSIGIASVLEDNEGHEEWLQNINKQDWRFWPRLQEYLQGVDPLPRNTLAEHDSSTDDVLGRLESPSRSGSWDRRGLVFGHVQSGKTTHYTALAAKALDAGYQVVIVLAGIHNSLRSQTHERLDYQLLGRDSTFFIQAATRGHARQGSRHIGVGERDIQLRRQQPPSVTTFTSSAENGDFRRVVAQQIGMDLGEGSRLVMVVKKNKTILENLINWLNSLHPHNTIDVPTLVIDDEADQASLDTNHDPETEPRRINGLIRRLLLCFERVGFVGYTATPFANIFIPPEIEYVNYGRDLFPEQFIVNLQAPSDYIGPSVVFGNPGDESIGMAAQAPLPMFIPVTDTEIWMPDRHRRTHQPGALPASLKEALLLFILVSAARNCRGHINVHNSMLVHVTRFVDIQARIQNLIDQEIDTWQELILHAEGSAYTNIRDVMLEIWNRQIVTNHQAFTSRFPDHNLSLPEWTDLWAEVPNVFEKIQTYRINSTSDDALMYRRNPEGVCAVIIGGDRLSRGLTLEGLSISYFLRTSRMYDTLMQMGRWFGYRRNYVDLCRTYTLEGLRNAFREITLAVEELRNDLDFMADANMKPRDFGLRVRTPSDGLLVTSSNKMRSGEVITVRFAGELVQTLIMPRGESAEENRRAVIDLVERMTREPERHVRGKASAHFLWHSIPASSVMDFLSAYNAFHTPSFCRHCDGLRRFITSETAQDELTEWTVVIVSRENPLKNNLYTRIGSLKINFVSRKPQEDSITNDRFETQALVGSADEALDLPEGEYNNIISPNSQDRGKREPGRANFRQRIREIRPASRGLLLIYLIADPVNESGDSYIPAIAVSFPVNLTLGEGGYIVTDDWLRQHGNLEDWDEE